VTGRVVALPGLRLGAVVRAGDVLVEIDSDAQRLELGEALARDAALGRQIDALRAEIGSERAALAAHRRQGASEIEVARRRLDEGKIASGLARDELGRAEQLRVTGSIPEAEERRLAAEDGRRKAAEAALAADVQRRAAEASASAGDRLTRIAARERDLAGLEGDVAALRARAARLRHDIERRTIRAPEGGAVGAVGPLHMGSVVAEGERVAAIVATGDMRVVGAFQPAGVFGRVRPGQRARVQFDGFPWTEYGMLTASVSAVTAEVREGRARVELTVEEGGGSHVPLQHGLPGQVSIEIERTTPARLALRAAGKALSSTPSPGPAPQAGEREARR
jgi:multidrug resistance efflux pump